MHYLLFAEKCLHLWSELVPGPGHQEAGEPYHHPGQGQGAEECPGIQEEIKNRKNRISFLTCVIAVVW